MQDKFEQLLFLASRYQATDIHFCVSDTHMDVKVRGLHGLETIHSPAIDIPLFNYLKYLSNIDLGSYTVPQSGNFQYTYHRMPLYFRFSILTTNHMQTAVLRILNNHISLSLEDLSTDKKQYECFKRWTAIRSGLIVFSGPTGSGKTTTLHAILHRIAEDHHLQVTSLEDPIEIIDDSYIQLQINEKNHFTYEEGIKQLLRHDPDVIMIGEIRDSNSARMLLRSALSGHLIFTTIHAKSCLEAIKRLNEFGLSNHELSHTLTGIVSQRLFPVYKKKERVCIYEILEKDALEYCLLHEKEPLSHENIFYKIKKAVEAKQIDKKEAATDLNA